jgi:hypothetical protein
LVFAEFNEEIAKLKSRKAEEWGQMDVCDVLKIKLVQLWDKIDGFKGSFFRAIIIFIMNEFNFLLFIIK